MHIRALAEKTSTELKALIGKTRLLSIDEAQRVTNIGITLKLFVDAIPETQVIATGSSSFELSNRIVEPLTGRKNKFHLHPFSLEELGQIHERREVLALLPVGSSLGFEELLIRVVKQRDSGKVAR